MTTRKLNAKQEKFYRAYLETDNASEAYLQVYNTARMKPDREIAGRLAVNESKLRQAAEERYFVSKERIIRELALIGFSNMLDYIQPQDDGTAYVDLSTLTPGGGFDPPGGSGRPGAVTALSGGHQDRPRTVKRDALIPICAADLFALVAEPRHGAAERRRFDRL